MTKAGIGVSVDGITGHDTLKERRKPVVFQTWILHQNPEFISIDKETNDNVMHLVEFGEANGLPYQSFKARPQGQVFSFDLLGIRFTDEMPFGWQVTFIGAPIIGIKSGDPERF